MGEIQQHAHHLDPDQFATIVRLLDPPQAAEPAAPKTPYDLGLEPWAFHSAGRGGDVVAYVDDRDQVRYVPLTRITEVPKTWRRVWLESRQ